MKLILRFSFSIICGLFISMPLYAAKTSGDQSLDRIIAVVNDAPITQTEINDAISNIKKQMEASGTTPPSDGALRKQVLDQVINRKLELQLAEQAGLKVEDEQLDKALTHIAQENNLTLAQLYEQVQHQGLSV